MNPWRNTETLNALSELFITAVNYRDPTAREHAQRVRGLAMELAQRVTPVLPVRMAVIGWGALVHDVGKIAISDEVLNKDKALTNGEWAMMRSHAELGYRLIAPLETWPEILSAVRNHHENYDGTGYPDKLKGKRIPFIARLLRIVDTFEALTAFRNYREVHTYARADAIHVMQDQAGYYDPELFEAFVAMIKADS